VETGVVPELPEVQRAGPSRFFPKDSECIVFDDSGEQVFTGEISDEESVLSEEISEIGNAYPNDVAGAALCSNRIGVTIFAANESREMVTQVKAVAARHPNFPVIIKSVALGLDPAMEIAYRLLEDDPESAIREIGPDVYTGGLAIKVRSTDMTRIKNPVTAQSIYSDVKRIEHADVPIRVTPVMVEDSDEVELMSRSNDSAPWWMGSSIYSNTYGAYCSTGLAINVDGAKRLLTAGHCLGASFSNSGVYVGGQYTTTFPGNAYRRGDFKVLQGSTYANKVWNGTVTGTSYLPISSANWGTKPIGDGICTSGRTTGQVCRYFITAPSVTVYLRNSGSEYVEIGPMVRMRHDSTGGSGLDGSGLLSGDSGGPCYYSDGKGGVIALGLVTGAVERTSPRGSKDYYCTLLKGVRAWNSGATLG
jgi:hypothetical protein